MSELVHDGMDAESLRIMKVNSLADMNETFASVEESKHLPMKIMKASSNDTEVEYVDGIPLAPRTRRGPMHHKTGIMGRKQEVFVSAENGTLILIDPKNWCIINRLSLFRTDISIHPKDAKLIQLRFNYMGKNGYPVSLIAKSIEEQEEWVNTFLAQAAFSDKLDEFKLDKIQELGDEEDLIAVAKAMGGGAVMSRATKTPKKRYSEAALPSFSLDNMDEVEGRRNSTETTDESMEVFFVGSERAAATSGTSDAASLTLEIAEPVTCQGWLLKKGEAHSAVKTRFFFAQNGHLRYFSSDNIPVDKSQYAIQDDDPATAAVTADATCVEEQQHGLRDENDDGDDEEEEKNNNSSSTTAVDDDTGRTPASSPSTHVGSPIKKSTSQDFEPYSSKTVSKAVCKGRLNLTGYEIETSNTADSVTITLNPGPTSKCRRPLTLYCDDHADKIMWCKALREHLAFRTT